ncbi:hypothetical protein B296_00022659 [Ensete ventricosum]|uniref:Uncharacterized protein n=1 Tax=Ensete ventricosum TaxID=4639 RepID=A0A427AXF6_ENSVE|nr:hypothetical protein B296_00022659 [Ensete ventricosum]
MYPRLSLDSVSSTSLDRLSDATTSPNAHTANNNFTFNAKTAFLDISSAVCFRHSLGNLSLAVCPLHSLNLLSDAATSPDAHATNSSFTFNAK